MTRVTPAQYMQKWQAGINGSTAYITAGVNAVKTAPGIAAAAAQNLMLQNLTAAVTSGRWAQAVSGVSLQSWQQAMLTKGIPNLSAGVQLATTQKLPAITTLLQNVDNAVSSLASTPRGNLQQNIQRAVQFMTAMSASSKGSS